LLPGQYLRQTEIQNLRDTFRGHLDVGRLNIAVCDVFPVRFLQPFGDLAADRQRFL